MRFPSLAPVLVVAFAALSPHASAGMKPLGVFEGDQVVPIHCSDPTDAPSPYPNQAQPPVGNLPTVYSAHREIKFTRGQAQDLRLDLAWLEATDTVFSATGSSICEVNRLNDCFLRDADGRIVAPALGRLP